MAPSKVELIFRKAKDLKYMAKMQQKHYMKLGVNQNKLNKAHQNRLNMC